MAPSNHRRNFEAGIVTAITIARRMTFLDAFYLGDHCLKCQRRDMCQDPVV